MPKLSEKDRARIIQILESGEDVPIDYKHILFPPERNVKKIYWPIQWQCRCSPSRHSE